MKYKSPSLALLALLAASTVGSLVGTFATTHALLPSVGVSWTFSLSAATLAFAGGLALVVDRSRVSVGAVVGLGAAFVLPGMRMPEMPDGARELLREAVGKGHGPAYLHLARSLRKNPNRGRGRRPLLQQVRQENQAGHHHCK